jgi:hypothetical protein
MTCVDTSLHLLAMPRCGPAASQALTLRGFVFFACSFIRCIVDDFAAYLFSRFRHGQIGHLSI